MLDQSLPAGLVVAVSRRAARDAVIEEQAAGLEQAIDLGKVFGQMTPAYVLEHADAHDIELIADVVVILNGGAVAGVQRTTQVARTTPCRSVWAGFWQGEQVMGQCDDVS